MMAECVDRELPKDEEILSQHVDGDTISRQAAIDALWKALYEY